MLRPDDLVLCAGTVAGSTFEDRARAAAASGFAGLSLFPGDYQSARAEGHSDSDLRGILADNGLEIAELDPLLRWVPDVSLGAAASEEGEAFFASGEEEFYAIGEALRARSINVALFTDETIPHEKLVEAFAALCDRAHEHGLLVHLEFMPWSQVSNLATAWEIVAAADRENGGIMFDSWHHFRSGGDAKSLATVPASKILAVQLNDAPQEAEPDPIAETLNRRKLPGEGDIDLVECLSVLRDGGSPAPLGVEVFAEELMGRPVETVAHRVAEATRTVLAKRA